jgi:hypothetical protein
VPGFTPSRCAVSGAGIACQGGAGASAAN